MPGKGREYRFFCKVVDTFAVECGQQQLHWPQLKVRVGYYSSTLAGIPCLAIF